jgi:hypothetical protein
MNCYCLGPRPLQTEEIPGWLRRPEKLDVKISAEEAGEAFPYEWPPVE